MENRFNKNTAPHMAIITFEIKVHELYQDGSYNPVPVVEEELKKYGVARYAKIAVEGFDRASCIENLKKKLEKLNEQ